MTEVHQLAAVEFLNNLTQKLEVFQSLRITTALVMTNQVFGVDTLSDDPLAVAIRRYTAMVDVINAQATLMMYEAAVKANVGVEGGEELVKETHEQVNEMISRLSRDEV